MFLLLSSLQPKQAESLTQLNGDLKNLIECLHDGMTECIYQHPVTSFAVETKPQPVFEVDILGQGRAALEKANDDLGETGGDTGSRSDNKSLFSRPLAISASDCVS